jgi:hypothetical protein
MREGMKHEEAEENKSFESSPEEKECQTLVEEI